MPLKTGLHEILFRFGRDRSLQGFHVVLVHQATDESGKPILKPNGEVALESFSEPMSLARARKEGLEAKDVDALLAQTLQAAVDALESSKEEVDRLQSSLERQEAELEASRKALLGCRAELERIHGEA